MPVELLLECLGADAALELRAVGGCPALGNWDPSRGVVLKRCAGGRGDAQDARWQLEGGPLLLSDSPENLPRKFEYCYVMLCQDGAGGYRWEDLGSLRVPMLRGRAGAGRRLCARRVNRCLMMPSRGHALLTRRDTWGAAEGCTEESARCMQSAWGVPEDFAPGLAGGSWAVGPHISRVLPKGVEQKHSCDGCEQAHSLFVQARRARLLQGLGQLSQRVEERSLVPRHVLVHVGEFLGDAAALGGF